MRETFSSHRRRHSFNAFLSLRASLLISLCVLCASLVPLCSAQGTGKDLAVLAGRSAEYILGCELDGTLFAVDAESGDVRWRLENPTKTFFRASASVADLTEALRKNDSLKAPLFVPSLDGGLFFFTETGSFQQLSKSAKDIVMNPPFITEDGSVLIGKKDTQIFVIELATGRVIDSVVASDDDPIASMPFTGHWPPGCVLISASTYTVKGLHPLSPENKWSVVLTEYLPVLTTLVDEGPNTAPASGSAFLVSPSGDMYCVDENSRVVWTLPWTAQLAAVFRITFSTAGTGRIAREELTLVSDKVKPSALSLDHAPVYVGQLNGQLFAAPYKKAISGAQLNRPGLLQIAPPVEVEEPEVCLMNGSIVGIHLLPTPSSTALLPADSSAIVPSPSPLTLPSSSPQSETPLAPPRSNFVFTTIALGVICILGGYIAIDRHKRRRAARAASLASPPVPPVAEISTEEAGAIEPADPTLTAKRKKKKHQQQQGVLTRGDAPAPPSPATSSSPTDSTPAVTPSPAAAPVEPALPPGVKRVGKIELQMERILGYGSNGTVVYEGCFDGRRVAVKRLLRTMYDVASKEVTLFVESDEHPHVVRYFAKEEDGDFIYLALTLCVATLEDLISPPPDKVPIAPVVAPPISVIVLQLALGLQHLHALHIIHRDLKPANVLLDHRAVVRIADMGLARKMGPDEFSVSGGSLKSAMAGSLGWRPPEICKVHHAALADPTASPGAARLHLSKKMDIFALGCIFYYVVTKGKHPFGQPFEREANILANRYRLDDPRCPYEAADLIRSMINPEPKLRPNIEQVLKHPFFWDANKKLLFFRDASDRVEVEKANAPVVLALEARAPSVIGGAGWGAVVDAEMLDNGGKYRKYNFGSIRDLLRVIRNKSHHYRDLPLTVQARIGSLPDGFLAYFMSRFPGLLLEVYRILQHYYPGEPALRQYM